MKVGGASAVTSAAASQSLGAKVPKAASPLLTQPEKAAGCTSG
jgi:hypothetical protein